MGETTMSKEAIKTFILVVLVAISFLLSFILWSYQPNYEFLYDADYVGEVDIGGNERKKNELIKPNTIVFHENGSSRGFKDMVEQQQFYQTLTSWELYDFKVKEIKDRPDYDRYAEIIFPMNVPSELLYNIFTFHDEVNLPDWTFSRVLLNLNEESKTVKLRIISSNHDAMIETTIEKSDAYRLIEAQMKEDRSLQSFAVLEESKDPVYVPIENLSLTTKTLVGSKINAEEFIDALFNNPNLVTHNAKEDYFTDGQRGMRIVQDGRLLQFINPLQERYARTNATELLDRSMEHINEHKGWTNNYYLEQIRPATSTIKYRLYYEGYPVYNYGNLSIIEQAWREQDLHQYNRSLFRIGNLLNKTEANILTGEQVLAYLREDQSLKLENIQNVQVGYILHVLDDDHSIMLEPNWFIQYEGEWIKFQEPSDDQDEGGD